MKNNNIEKDVRAHSCVKWLRGAVAFCLLLAGGMSVSAGEMTEPGVGVLIYPVHMQRAAESWGIKIDDFLAEHFAILEKNGVNMVQLAVSEPEKFKSLYLPLLEKHKIKTLLQLNFAYFRNNGDWGNPKYMDKMARKAAAFINQYKSHPNVVSFSIREEAAAEQMKMLSDYYTKILEYAPGARIYFVHNSITAAKAHLKPYPQILGTDRYTFFCANPTKPEKTYVSSPASAVDILRNDCKSYYKEAAARDADFLLALCSANILRFFAEFERAVPDAERRAQIEKLADERNIYFRLKTGQAAYWSYYNIPENCLKACMWTGILEGAKHVLFYLYCPMTKGKSFDNVTDWARAKRNKPTKGGHLLTMAGQPGKPNRWLNEFAETAKEIKTYGKIIMKMKKVIDDKEPVITFSGYKRIYAQRFAVNGIQGNITVIQNSQVGTWPGKSPHYIRPKHKISFDDNGDLVGYVPNKEVAQIAFKANLKPGEAVWRLDTNEKLKESKVGVKPGSGILLFTGTEEEFNKLRKIAK